MVEAVKMRSRGHSIDWRHCSYQRYVASSVFESVSEVMFAVGVGTCPDANCSQ